MLIHTVSAPWEATLTPAEHTLTLYFLVVAMLGFVGGLARAWVTRNEVGARYRTAVAARLGVMGVALVSYVFLVVEFIRGYTLTDRGWEPTPDAIMAFASRYMEWSVSVPLLTVELLAVCTLLGPAARRIRFLAAGGAFMMIFTGFLGGAVIGGGESRSQLVFWGIISCIFWIFTTILLGRTVLRSLPGLTAESSMLLRNATILLLGGWVIYPLVYLIQIYGFGGGWTTTAQIVYTMADVTVKLGFAGVIHRVAKLRTAEDVRAGDDVHPEAIWISSIKQSDAGLPVVVYLAAGAVVHHERSKPAGDAAIPMTIDSSNELDQV